MIQAHTISTMSPPAAAFRRATTRPRCGGKSYTDGLKARLSIAPGQAQAWAAFAHALSANHRRTLSGNDGDSSPFGPLAHRLAALDSMKRAAERLLAVLDPAQRRAAAQALPLCCLQQAADIRRRPT